MTTNESRWAQIVFWNRENLDELHRRELLREKENESRAEAMKSPIDVWDFLFIERMQGTHELVPYWDSMLPESARTERMAQFCREIYTSWRPFFGQGGQDPEISVLHKADNAIFKIGIKPNRGNIQKFSDKKTVR